jgi:hypothetical protein
MVFVLPSADGRTKKPLNLQYNLADLTDQPSLWTFVAWEIRFGTVSVSPSISQDNSDNLTLVGDLRRYSNANTNIHKRICKLFTRDWFYIVLCLGVVQDVGLLIIRSKQENNFRKKVMNNIYLYRIGCNEL